MFNFLSWSSVKLHNISKEDFEIEALNALGSCLLPCELCDSSICIEDEPFL